MTYNHNDAYLATQDMYNELQEYLDSIIPSTEEDELLVDKCNVLGEQVRAYHVAIIEENSCLNSIHNDSIKVLIEEAKIAKQGLKDAENKMKVVAKVAKAVDKVLEQLAKFI